MPKTYRYKNLSFALADDAEAIFSVKFISDGNSGHTVINIPGDNDPEIQNEGEVSLGKGKELRKEKTVSFSSFWNLISQVDEIRVQFKINNQLLVEHANSKIEEERPFVVLNIDFPSI